MTAINITYPTKGTALAQWNLLDGTVPKAGVAADLGAFREKSIQIAGTFGVGGAITIEGSNDGSVWAALSDIDLGPISGVNAAAIHQIWENTRFVRPSLTAGDGDTDLTITLFAASGSAL